MAKKRDERPKRVYRGPVLRLRVVVADRRWRVEKTTRIDRMTLMASWNPDERAIATAPCFELVNGKGEVVYRRPMPTVHDTSVELYESGVPHREEAERELMFSVLVPEIDGESAVRLVDRGELMERADDKRSAYEIEKGE